jgi:hypothetical protein
MCRVKSHGLNENMGFAEGGAEIRMGSISIKCMAEGFTKHKAS